MTTPSWIVRPLPAEARAALPADAADSPFQAPWSNTLTVLDRELAYLRATHVLLELEVPDDFMGPPGDGPLGAALVRLNADGPRVRLSFDSRHGPLSYATGRYGTSVGPTGAWRANVRAIALALEALRRVDRYGIATHGEQYAGWITAPAGEPLRSATELVQLAGLPGVTTTQVVADVATFRRLYRAAAARLDPDAGGDLAAWHRLQRARAVLADHHRSEP